MYDWSGTEGFLCRIPGSDSAATCTYRYFEREIVFHGAAVTRFCSGGRGVAPTGELGFGPYLYWSREGHDHWLEDGTHLPHLSSPMRTEYWGYGLGLHGAAGLRYQPGDAPFALTLDIRGRLAAYMYGDMKSETRNAVAAMLGVAWN